MVKVFCVIVGVAGSAFSVRVDESGLVDDLKKVIKEKKPNRIQCDADELKLFLAKKEKGAGAWLTEKKVQKGVRDTTDFKQLNATGAPVRLVGLSEEDVKFVPTQKDVETMNMPVHVLVVVPIGGKRQSLGSLFDESFKPTKKRRVGENGNKARRFFNMKHFPTLLEHPMVEFNSIMERDAYTVIFARMVKYAKDCFEFPLTTASDSDEHRESGKGSNVVVTGNPGTGKSRFLLFCMFQLTLGEQEDVQQLPLYELVVNHTEKYVKYDAATKEFVDLDKADVSALMGQRHVLRLVEATSSELTGWSGVSVLFASPGVEGYEKFEKVDGLTFTMPTWILEELKDCTLSALPRRHGKRQPVHFFEYIAFRSTET